MDYTDLLPVIAQYVTLRGVALAVLVTQLVKYWIPGPTGEKGSPETVPGALSTRLLPFLPVLVGIFYCVVLEQSTSTIMENAIRGFFTGSLGAYTYRTAKVSIFGA